ncbi:MAG: ABC transporter permease [Micrococcales bacterium]|nr:ABC transporter permease [Micrococcales bacterium]
MSSNRLPPWLPILAITLVATVVMSCATGRFLTSSNIYVILLDAALLAVIGLSQLVVLSVGEFSLAIGGIGAVCGITTGYLLVVGRVPVLIGVAVGLAVGAACGALNGLLVAKTSISGFIITLATGGAFSGLAVGFTKTQPFNRLPSAFTTFGTGRWGALPICIFATILLVAASAAFFRWNRLGRRILAVGSNSEAVTLAGLSKKSAVVAAHVLSGATAAAAGLIATAQLHEANSSIGTSWVISSLTVAVIGGTSLNGGSVSHIGLFTASVVLAVIADSLVLLNINPFWVTLAEGLLILGVVVAGRVSGRGPRMGLLSGKAVKLT